MPSTTLMMQESSSRRLRKKLIYTQSYNFNTVIDGEIIVNNSSELTINSGCTITTSNRCDGLVFMVEGNATINGTLTMTSRGSNSVGDNLAIDYRTGQILINPSDWDNYTYKISSSGSTGGTRVTGYSTDSSAQYVVGITGSSALYSCGGGGSGSAMGSWGGRAYSGSGGNATSYSGGAGGGGCSTSAGGTHYASNGTTIGGAAHASSANSGSPRSSGGGAGNPGGAGAYTYSSTPHESGQTGTGGLLILVVKGNLTIGATGIISSNGAKGGTGYLAGGGGSGGGNIIILYTGSYSNSGTIQANGGQGGGYDYSYAAGRCGGNGGAGSIVIEKITL